MVGTWRAVQARLRGGCMGMVMVAVASAPPAAAQGPADWCPEPRARAFDFWIGEWDVANRNRRPEDPRWYDTGRATDRVYPVVGGCAIVEHWRGYAFPAAGHIVGFSVRAWDPEAERWDLVLLWPMAGPPAFGELHGRFRHGRGDFFSRPVTPAGDTIDSRLTFTDVGPDAFRWNNGISRDGGLSWVTTWIMEFTRRPPLAGGLLNDAHMTTAHCTDDEHRAFDAHLGEWEGTRVDSRGDSIAVRTHLLRILEGCAVMQRTTADNGSFEAFQVRAFEPRRAGWVEYRIASDRRKLTRRQAVVRHGDYVFTDTTAVEGRFHRDRWVIEPDELRLLQESAPDADGPWTPVAETRYRRHGR